VAEISLSVLLSALLSFVDYYFFACVFIDITVRFLYVYCLYMRLSFTSYSACAFFLCIQSEFIASVCALCFSSFSASYYLEVCVFFMFIASACVFTVRIYSLKGAFPLYDAERVYCRIGCVFNTLQCMLACYS
jgi:hypothetical protein